jgi:putative SOS response-associated peptidase YedK
LCNAYRLITPAFDLFEVFSQIRLPILKPDPSRRPNLEPREITRPTDSLPILRALDPAEPAAGLELVEARWWLVPFFHKGPTVKDWKPICTNARAETVATTPTYREPYRKRRCLIPADGFYEWTGEKGAKTRWLFTRPADEIWCFAGLWDRWTGPEGSLDSFTLVTTAAGPDVAPIHHRQPVLLEPAQWSRWLDLSADPAPLLNEETHRMRIRYARNDAPATVQSGPLRLI